MVAPPARAQAFEDPRFSTEVVTTLPAYQPVELDWSPAGDLYILQRDGVVRVFADGQLQAEPFVDLRSQVNTFVDRGMLGMTLHPDFEQNGYVYLTYVHEPGPNPGEGGPKLSRLVRITANPSNPRVALAGSELVLIGTLPATAPTHTVGALRFGEDGKLFLGQGDGSFPSRYQLGAVEALSIDSYSGKILRLNDDGTAPTDNPFYDGTNSVRSRVWAYGLRNPFRFALHPTTGEPFIGDVGWDTWEEINHGVAGSNFGWPCYEGSEVQPEYAVDFAATCAQYPPASVSAPVFQYKHSDLPPEPDALVSGDSVTAGTFYTGGVYPDPYPGSLFLSDYVGGWVLRMAVDDAGRVTDVQPFATGLDSPVALAQGPDGLLYYVSFVTGQIRRIRYLGPVAVASASPTSGYSPLDVTFSSAGSTSAQPAPLSYWWEFGDGAVSTEANPSHTFTSATVATRTARLTVTDSSLASATASIEITINSAPPSAQISTPPAGGSVYPGQVVSFHGSAFDADEGALPAKRLQWTILLHHDTHVHTVLSATGAFGSFEAEYHGPGSYSYEILLRATDASGLSGLANRTVGLLPDSTPPSPPGSLSAIAVGAGRIDLSWVPATDVGGIASYRIERCTGSSCSNFSEIASTVTPDLADDGLAALTPYRYRIRAVDPTGNVGPYSAVAQATTPAGSVPVGLVAAFDFDDGGGSVASDVTGRGHDASIIGASWIAGGRHGGALEFDGGNDLLTIAPSPELDFTGGATLEAWAYPLGTTTDWATIIHHEVNDYFLHSSNEFSPMHPTSGVRTSNGVSWAEAPSPIPVGVWTHLASTYDGSSVRVYVNGTLVQSGSAPGGIAATSNSVRIGGNVSFGEFFDGRIDDVRLYNRALGQSEIVADRDSAVAPAASGPPGVPGMQVSKNDAAGSSLTLWWDDSCGGVATHHIVFGGGSQLPSGAAGSFGATGTVCAASTPHAWNSPATTIDPSGLVWWIIVAADANATEGSWGTDGLGRERAGPGPGGSSGACGTAGKSLSSTCGR